MYLSLEGSDDSHDGISLVEFVTGSASSIVLCRRRAQNFVVVTASHAKRYYYNSLWLQPVWPSNTTPTHFEYSQSGQMMLEVVASVIIRILVSVALY